MNLSRALLSLMVEAILYAIVSSAVLLPKSHFLSMSTSLYCHYFIVNYPLVNIHPVFQCLPVSY